MFLGSGNRVLVFMDVGDIAWTSGVLFIPLTALFVIPLTAGMALPKDANVLTWRVVIDHPLFATTVAIMVALWGYSLTVAILTPIAFNGFVVGVLIAVLKLIVATLFAFLAIMVWCASMSEYRQKRRPNRFWIASLLGALGWIAFCLVNGHRVFERRELLAERDNGCANGA
jgi:hypothetical protein